MVRVNETMSRSHQSWKINTETMKVTTYMMETAFSMVDKGAGLYSIILLETIFSQHTVSFPSKLVPDQWTFLDDSLLNNGQ